MKTTLRIPMKEQYAYIEVENETASVEEAVNAYNEIQKLLNPSGGLDDKTWRTVLDKYLTENTMHTEEYYAMNPEQQRVIQEIKKSLKRLEAKQITVHND